MRKARLGTDKRYIYVAADIYHLPLADGSCDAAVMERVIHHMADVPAALRQIRAALAPGSPFVLEYASKRNLKAIVRYALRRQTWSPFDLEPVEFVKLNFDFHPAYMAQLLARRGLYHRTAAGAVVFPAGDSQAAGAAGSAGGDGSPASADRAVRAVFAQRVHPESCGRGHAARSRRWPAV